MSEKNATQVGSMRVRTRREPQQPSKSPEVIWKEATRRRPGEHLLRNLAVAACMLMCAVALRSGAIPQLSPMTDAVLAAATDDSLLDEQLGRLTFVSTLFPEATLVFGESSSDEMALPVSGGMVVHAWSEAEPWMAWRTQSRTVNAAAPGEVIGVYHGNGDERLVQVLGSDGLSCLYGNLADVAVALGDAVSSGDAIGTLMPGTDAVFEVRRDGMSIDPALFLGGV